MTTPGTQPSIARKLTGLTVRASGTALVIACLAFGMYDRTTFRATLAQRLSTQAELLAANSRAALVFDDPSAAETTLSALSGAPNIVGSVIVREDGTRFAGYERDRETPLPASAAMAKLEVPRFESNRLLLTHAIVFQGKRLGSVTLASDLAELDARQRDYFKMSLLVLFASLAASFVMSWLSQRSISGPIVQLARVVDTVAAAQDYSGRAVIASGAREITTLATTFNHMLGQIEERDRSLQRAHNSLEERVHQRTAELDAANRELEAFSYSVSHDLRAPLRHVSGFTQLLEEHAGPQLDDQGRKYLQTIATASHRMARLIDDLLAFSRIGRSPLTNQRVSLNAIVAEAKREVTAQLGPAAATDRTIVWEVSPLPDVSGDPAMLRLAFVNLLSNAVKYTSTRPEARIQIGVEEDRRDRVEVFVRDNGVGFDMKYADKLFGVFQRLHRASEFEGTGIGLANVKRTITRHGGNIRAWGQVDGGAVFYVTLLKSEAP